MSACINHDKNEFMIMLFPNKQPVRLDMTFPLSFTIPRQDMCMIFFF